MKTRGEYYKKNILLTIIWHVPIISLIYIPLQDMLSDNYMLIGITTLLYLYICINSLDRWYNDEIFEQLNNKIKELEDKQ